MFPAFHALVPPGEYAELGEKFEDKEEDLFGKGGFANVVEQMAAIERMLDVYNLAAFDPAP